MTIRLRVNHRSTAITHGILLAALAANAAAQPALEEVLVTAQKREQGLQEAPISLAVFTEAAIERLGITNVGDISNNVPNVRGTTFGVSPTTMRFYIRGIGISDAQVTQDPPVGVYLDNVYLARNSALTLDVADIERIEVLRGPQGTLYGRNTTGGAINIISAKPSDEFGFKQKFSFGDYSLFRSQSILNVPLGDTLAAKLVYEHHERDGWIENKGGGDDFNQFDKDALRIALRWTPSDDVTIDYTYDRSENDFTGNYYTIGEPSAGAPPTVVAQTDRQDEAALPTPMKSSTDEGWGHALHISWMTGLGEFRSITAYRELEQFVYNDFSGNPTTSVFQNDPLDLQHEQFSQELQLLGSTGNGQFDYVFGLYYFEEEGHEVAVDKIPLFGAVSPRDVTAENEALAAYTELGWTPGGDSDWHLVLGGRYTEDDRSADNNIDPEADESYSKFTPSFTVNYELNDDINLYGKVSTGYKSGGFNLRAAFFTESFDEENLISYEAGWKTEWMDRRVRFNGAVFFMDYDDIQLNILVPDQPNPTLTQTENAGTSEIWGVETDLSVAFSERVTGTLSYGYLDTEVTEVEGDDADLYDLPNAPEHSMAATLSWRIAEFSAGALRFDADYSWRDDSFTGGRVQTGDDIDAYGVTNLRLSLDGEDWLGRGDYSVALWVRNLGDEEYLTDTFGSFSGLHANQIGAYGDPRTYGVDLTYRFR